MPRCRGAVCVGLAFAVALLPGLAWAKRPDPDRVYWGVVKHKGTTAVLPAFQGQVMVRVRLGGVLIEESAMQAGQDGYVLKVPMDDGVEPRLPATARGGEGIKIYLRNTETGDEFEVDQTEAGAEVLSATKGHVEAINLTIDQDLGTPGGVMAQYAQWAAPYESTAGVLGLLRDGAKDQDGDGMPNFAEFLANTDPLSPLDRLRIIRFTHSRGVNNIVFGPVHLGRRYRIYCSETLGPGDWTEVGARVPGRTDASEFFDHVSSQPRLFYKVGVELE